MMPSYIIPDPGANDHLTQAEATVCREVTLIRLSRVPVMRTPWTATFCALRLEGLKNLTPSSWYWRLPNGSAASAFKATDDVAWVLDITGSPASVNIHAPA